MFFFMLGAFVSQVMVMAVCCWISCFALFFVDAFLCVACVYVILDGFLCGKLKGEMVRRRPHKHCQLGCIL